MTAVASWIEALTGPLEQKKQYRHAKSRIDGLPEPYRGVATAMNRYCMLYAAASDGDTVAQMIVDLADLFERASIESTPIAAIVGDDPVDFAQTFADAYSSRSWLDKERARLLAAVQNAEPR